MEEIKTRKFCLKCGREYATMKVANMCSRMHKEKRNSIYSTAVAIGVASLIYETITKCMRQ